MISIVLATMSFVSSPAEEPKERESRTVQVISYDQPNTAFVELLRADYTDGKYNDYLKKMDKNYESGKKEGHLEGLIELRNENAKINQNPDFIHSFQLIQQMKDVDLRNAVADEGETSFAQKVRSATEPLSKEEIWLMQLHNKTPGAGNTNDENRLIEIELEYTYKTIHLDSQVATGKSVSNAKEKRLVLEIEKMDRMIQVSQTFEDETLKSAVILAAAKTDARLVKQLDMSELYSLAKGKLKPSSAIEEKVAAIISQTQEKVATLHQNMQENVKSN